MDPLQPSTRNTPMNAYYALRSHGAFANVLHVQGLARPQSLTVVVQGQGIGGPLLGGVANVRANGSF